MLFTSPVRRLDYVVRPKVPQRNALGIQTGVHPSHLRVEFRGNAEGVFDSESDAMKRAYKRVAKSINELEKPDEPLTPEAVQAMTEEYLLNHEDHGKLFYLVTDPNAVEAQKHCIAPKPSADEPNARCDRVTEGLNDYCNDCIREMTHVPQVVRVTADR